VEVEGLGLGFVVWIMGLGFGLDGKIMELEGLVLSKIILPQSSRFLTNL